jgi:hypothetical protein
MAINLFCVDGRYYSVDETTYAVKEVRVGEEVTDILVRIKVLEALLDAKKLEAPQVTSVWGNHVVGSAQ